MRLGGCRSLKFICNRLAAWLSDDTERVILIDKEFNFIGSEGSTTGQVCRSTERCGADDGGQDTIKDTCDDNEESVEGTWDNAGADGGLDVGSNKSLVGVGDQGVIRGKGLSIGGGASNIIIQNIHFTVRSSLTGSTSMDAVETD